MQVLQSSYDQWGCLGSLVFFSWGQLERQIPFRALRLLCSKLVDILPTFILERWVFGSSIVEHWILGRWVFGC
jgi:hypothetical protein